MTEWFEQLSSAEKSAVIVLGSFVAATFIFVAGLKVGGAIGSVQSQFSDAPSE